MDPLTANLGALGTIWALLRPPWALLGRPWGLLGRSWALLELSWALSGRSWGALGPSWALLDAIPITIGTIFVDPGSDLCAQWGSILIFQSICARASVDQRASKPLQVRACHKNELAALQRGGCAKHLEYLLS